MQLHTSESKLYRRTTLSATVEQVEQSDFKRTVRMETPRKAQLLRENWKVSMHFLRQRWCQL